MTLLQSPRFNNKKDTRSVGKGVQSVFLVLLTLTVGIGISTRLAYLQILKGKSLRKRAEANRIRIIPKQPERGNIFDRNGKLLATTSYPQSVYLWPMAHTKAYWSVAGPRLAEILEIPEAEIREKLEAAGPNSSSLVRVARNISIGKITALKEYKNELKGVEIHSDAVRDYPHGEALAHVLGYTRELTPEQLKEKRKEGYRLGDVIGQIAAEKAFEKTLRGEWGGQQVEVDGKGRPLRVLGEKQAKAGNDIRLTIDLDIQKKAYKALGNRNGAIVVLDPKNGEVLAMASRPSFDPNIFTKQDVKAKEIVKVLTNKQHPLLNRALRAYPPASTYKIVTTAAGLESGKFSPKTILRTYGSLTFGGTRFAEWNHAGFGPLGFTGAMAWSSDTFFYQVGSRIGGPTSIKWSRNFGFGRKTGFEFTTEESRGLVPDEKWKKRVWKIGWTVGDSVNMSIGQGALLSTPLQVAVMFAVPANGGYLVKPHILKDNKPSKEWRKSLNMKPSTVKVIADGLREVITDGTGKLLDQKTIPPSAGKSGTAEAWRPNRVKANHAWFGAYAPLDKPEIVVLAFGEHAGGGGSKIAAPMVLEVMQDYFHRKYPKKYKKPEKSK
ncbi:MAG: penicillin-binding protein 2 [Cyanobacteria bacterium P01_A01_bin.45]